MSNGKKGRGGPNPGRRWTAEDKVWIFVEAAALSDDELGGFLRREGLHEADLERIREEVQRAATEGLRAKPAASYTDHGPATARVLPEHRAQRRLAAAPGAPRVAATAG